MSLLDMILLGKYLSVILLDLWKHPSRSILLLRLYTEYTA